jgi:uncharacterized membrane protein YfcA
VEPLAAAGIAAAGVVMGAVNNLAGGGGALGLVALEVAGGLPVAAANASLRPAAVGISVGGHFGFRSRALRVPSSAWIFGALAVPGSVAGSYLVSTTPVWLYRLVLGAILGTVLWQQLRPGARDAAGRDAASSASAARSPWLAVVLFPLVGVFMGYVQVGSGLLIMAVMTLLRERDLVQVNASKMVIVLLSSVASVAYLAIEGTIHWPAALALAAGAAYGSFLAGRWSVGGGHARVRIAVLAITSIVLVYQATLLVRGV